MRAGVLTGIPLTFVILVVLFFPFRYQFEFDPDEGVNLMKSFLLLRGYRLYSEIWSDQPPVFSHLLAGWFRVLGEEVLAGRILVLVSSTGLLAISAAYLRRSWGLLAAWLALVFLLLLPFYPQLSVSVMIGLPSISMAIGSFGCLYLWHGRRQYGWLLLSAFLLAFSILTKLFTAVVVPVWLVGILLDARRQGQGNQGGPRQWMPGAVWLGALLAVGGIVAASAVGPSNLNQLVDAHLASAQGGASDAWVLSPPLQAYLGPVWAILLLAGLGILRGIRAGEWGALYLGGWVVGGAIFLYFNRPTWYHHQLLVTVPAALLAAIAGGGAVAEFVAWRKRRPATGEALRVTVSLALLVAFLAGRVEDARAVFDPRLPNLSPPPSAVDEDHEILALMWNYADEVDFVYTDRPIFAFSIGHPVPPNLAVITEKRIATGNLSDREILATLETYAPRMILTGQFQIPAVEQYMNPRNFSRLDSTLHYRLYLKPSTLQ